MTEQQPPAEPDPDPRCEDQDHDEPWVDVPLPGMPPFQPGRIVPDEFTRGLGISDG